jgi:membrane-bound lytic murein transglycosylase D
MKTSKALLFAAVVSAAPPVFGAAPVKLDRALEATVEPVELPPLVAEPSSFELGSAVPLPSSALSAEASDPAIDALASEDEPEVAKEIQAESKELEDVRAAEERKLGGAAAQAAARAAQPAAPGERIALIPELDLSLGELQAKYDIPIDVNEMVVEYIRFFQTEPVRKHFVKWLSRSTRYIPRYREIMKESGLPEDTVYLAMIESGFGNFAYSRAKASGPWQFIGSTGKLYGLKQDFWVDERRDPEKSARAAARFLKHLHDEMGDWRLAWASYNAGPGKIRKAQERGENDFWSMAAGRVLKAETKGYVPKLMAAAIISKHPEAFGFKAEELDPERWAEYETVPLSQATALAAVAQAAEVTEKEVHDLNPELRRVCTPPRQYALKVPKGTAETFARNWPEVSQSARLAFARHQVSKGETLARIASAYGVSPAAVLKMNGLAAGRRLRPGTELIIPLPHGGKSATTALASAAQAELEQPRRERRAAGAREPVAARDAQRAEERSGRMRSTVTVRSGETLWAIARKFGVDVDDLCRWNGIKNPRQAKIIVGQRLVVYPRTAVGEPSLGGRRGPG